MTIRTNAAPEELADEGMKAGVEQEETEHFSTHEPFDPASISISSKVVALDTVLRRIRNSTIKLAPSFQRNYVWDDQRKSLLIESMMLRIPLPMFYVSEDKDGVWEVVDGLQRLTTIRDYILGPDDDGKGFALKGLEFWGERFDGKMFFDIDKKMNVARIINNIMEAELSFTIINPDTPEKVKRNIFKRINTGGMRLSAQEIRHALYQGEATDLLKLLVNSNEYKSVIGETVKDNRMAGRELIIRYLSFNIRGWRAFKGDMDSFLSDTMRWINGDITFDKVSPYDQGRISSIFEMALSRNKKLFGDHAFRRSRGDQRRTPVNKSLFEMWMFCFSRISDDFFASIISRKKEFQIKYYDLLDYDDDFIDSIGRHGGDLIGVKNRYTKIIELLNEFKPSND
ncbi:DUF262 domain-containing protein [Burkholderia cepacia]|uniref:GmrSD restriction endonuclease domain-containing protein n=1 Tax=Burkholderia cepacia TaxID=292 RepID=UPI001CF13E08|nr:DUF262 domain-containing protein [Burkholderia cepacia]MCA8214187.1 DUF262 domain-containing protein [Burkholderia cepacia]